MNQENSSVLDLLRQAVEAAVGGERTGLEMGRPAGLSDAGGAESMGVDSTLGESVAQTSGAVVASVVSDLAGRTGGAAETPAEAEPVPLAGLTGAVAEKQAWADVVSRVNPITSMASGVAEKPAWTDLVSRVNPIAGLAGAVGKPSWTDVVSRVNPIAGLIAGLFTGKSEAGSSSAADAVATYLRPESMRLEAGFDGANNPAITAMERQEGGQFRPAAASNGGAQVVVQVQAMDSRSFLDHTPEIAEAVKRALLESNGLRDVLGEY